ncbi:hypothetical protein [Streptomyces inhibens]|uniref:hypothetical protein n=1 Tax=Streptomyces inhibens TaxID=2293571 RepID=UPI0015F26600|nr:hypothetical protein [Streptomyces inhibens]
MGGLFGTDALAPAGLPPFGTALGKAVTEEAVGDHVAWFLAGVTLLAALVM